MMRKGESNCIQYWFEFFFAANIALVTKLAQANGFLRSVDFGFSEMKLKYLINGYFHKHPHADLGGWIAFFVLAFLLAGLIFLVFRGISISRPGRLLLRVTGGAVSLIALPIFWLLLAHSLGRGPVSINPPRIWLVLELAACAFCAVIYLFGSLPMPGWLMFVLAVAHFFFWSWLLFGAFFVLSWSRLMFPLVALSSTITWGLYVSSLRGNTALPASQ